MDENEDDDDKNDESEEEWVKQACRCECGDVLAVRKKIIFDESIVRNQHHVIKPATGDNFEKMGLITFEINKQDLLTLPSESSLYIQGTFLVKANGTVPTNARISNNGFLYLFDEIRYNLNKIEIDVCRYPGWTTALKNYVSVSPNESKHMKMFGWDPVDNKASSCIDQTNGHFGICIPLNRIFGFAEDYRHVIVNCRQELVLRRSQTDNNCYELIDPTMDEECEITITNMSWRIPFVNPGREKRLDMDQLILNDTTIPVIFRSWELCDLPLLPETTTHRWNLKSLSKIEKPRYVIVGLQTDRKDNRKKSASKFDACDLQNVKLYIDEECFPEANLNLNFSNHEFYLMYEMYAKFQKSYHGKGVANPLLSPEEFRDISPLFVIDCTYQNDKIKTGAVDINLEFQTATNFPKKTAAYALIIHDSWFEYSPNTGIIERRVK